MSSKGRGAPVTVSEFYPTPAWCTRRILEALPSLVYKNAAWLEPCAGDGAIVEVLRQASPDSLIDAGDIRNLPKPQGVTVWKPGQSFMGWTWQFDAVITNPPFSLAEPLIDHFLPRCDWLVLLLRSGFKLVNSEGRNYRDNMPDEYKLPERPSFLASEKCIGLETRDTACGWSSKVALTVPRAKRCPDCGGHVQRTTSDSSEYSWFVWTPERGRSVGQTRVLPSTPAAERGAT